MVTAVPECRKARFEAVFEIEHPGDLPHPVPTGPCWVEERHGQVAIHVGRDVPSAVSSEAVVIRFFVTGSAMRAVDLWCHQKATEAGSSGRDLAQKCFVGLELRLHGFERRSY